jgi:hypothetical protein
LPGLPGAPDYYGSEGGQSWVADDDDLITIANPPPGDYSLMVDADYDSGTQTWPLASANLLIQAVPPTNVTFNGGTSAVSGQQAQSWRFFRVDVPAGVLGWDVRVRSVTGGNPQMVIRRDVLPDYPSTGGTWSSNNPPSGNATWPSGNSWLQSYDWTQRPYDADGTAMTSRRFVAGMGRPLEPGTYYVGVYNADSANPADYTVESRGIGTGQFYPVATLNFAAGSNATISNLAPREARYFKVSVPANTPSWEITLDPTLGEMLLMVRRGVIPDPEADVYGATQSDYGMRGARVQKDGPERYVILPESGQDFLVAGDYYLAVVSEGQSPSSNSYVGSGNSSGTKTWPLASADLLIRQKPPLPLNFDAVLNSGGGSNADSRQIINGERVVYAVPVPTSLSGSPVLGWIINVVPTQGNAILRV